MELVLLVLALAVGIGANTLVGVDRQKAFDTDFWFQSSLLAAAALAFHLVLRIRAKYADPVILPLVVALNGLGLAMIHRLDRVGEDTGNNQLRWTLVAMAVAIAVIWFLKDHRDPPPLHLHLPGRQRGPADPAAGSGNLAPVRSWAPGCGSGSVP